MSQTALAHLVGASTSHINGVIRRGDGMSLDTAQNIAAVLEVDVAWLLEGKGAGPRDAEGSLAHMPDGLLVAEVERRIGQARAIPQPVAFTADPEDVRLLEGDSYVSIPYAADTAAAGHGRVMEDEVAGYVVAHQRIAPHPDRLCCVQVDGESMLPVLPDGSIVAIDLSQRDPRACIQKIVCARTEDGEIVIKILLGAAGHIVVLNSWNTADEQFKRSIEIDTQENADWLIGRVVWAWVDLSR